MKGWKPALVGADMFTVDAFEQWKNKAIDAKIPFHGRYYLVLMGKIFTMYNLLYFVFFALKLINFSSSSLSRCSNLESDPINIAMEGVENFKKDGCDLIIIDTSGRHKQKKDLLEELCKIYKEMVYIQYYFYLIVLISGN